MFLSQHNSTNITEVSSTSIKPEGIINYDQTTENFLHYAYWLLGISVFYVVVYAIHDFNRYFLGKTFQKRSLINLVIFIIILIYILVLKYLLYGKENAVIMVGFICSFIFTALILQCFCWMCVIFYQKMKVQKVSLSKSKF